MEEEICETCLDVLLTVFEYVEGYTAYEHLWSQIEMMKLELNLLKMFFLGLTYLEELECDLHLRFAIKSMMQKLMQIVVELAPKYTGVSTNQNLLNLDIMNNMLAELKQIFARWAYGDDDENINLDVVMHRIGSTIDEQLRPQARDVCILLLGCANYNCLSCPPSQKKFCEYVRVTTSFIDLIFQNVKALFNSNLIAPVMKQQIGLIQVELEKYGTSMNLAKVKKLSELISRARTWFNRISCLTYLYWSDGKDESVSSITVPGTLLSGFLHENMHANTSGAISSMFQPTKIPQLLGWHLDFLLGDLALPMKDGLQEALIFMLSFIMDPPDVDSKDRERIWAKLYATINKFPSLIHSIRSGEMQEEICKANISNFLMEVDRVKAKVRELFLMNPYTTQFTAPSTNAIGFLSSLVENLSGIFERGVNLIPCIKHLCESLSTELESFQPHLKSIMELLQDDRDEEIKQLWRDMINMFYNVDYSTKLCLTRSFFTWWYVMIALPDLIEHTKVMKIQIKKLVELDKGYNKKRLGYPERMDGADALRENGMVTESERGSMGFIEVEKIIIANLLCGSQSLSIISISGSGGQGKTTLAKRIYDDPNIRCHFQSLVWVYVSKDCPIKKLLVQILSCITKIDGAEFQMEDLIVKIWRSLRMRRYLIVLDDIWDVDAWEQLQKLFPNDKNGSRILFTTRNHDLASKAAESNSISHRLPLFCEEESWELMKKRVFGSNGCIEEFVGIGKKIASHCKGLPLAVVLIAGVLRRTERNVDSWNKVAENLKAHLEKEGCGNVLELSYKYLQDHLKSCFLYFASFPRGENVRARNLKLLWIGEGFADHDDMALEYLKELVSIGLVDVTRRSSMGGIKSCNVHDLLYDLCLEKVKEDNFMHLAEESSIDWNIHRSSGLSKYNHHRLRIGESDPFIKSIPMVIKRELPSSPLHTFLWLTKNCMGEHFSLEFLASFRILSVLKLDLQAHVFPEVILACIYLRHLELHFGRRSNIRAIPPTIAKLWKLRILISTGRELTLPLSMWDMESLRYVDVYDAVLDLEGFDQKNSGKSNIVAVGNLCLDTDDCKTIEILRKFSNLRKFKCKSENPWKIKNMCPWLFSMVGSLLPQLESLHVGRCGYHIPTNWNFPYKIGNLTKLTFSWTWIPWSILSELGKQLPSLRVLKLRHTFCEEKSWRLEDGDFSNLIYLKIHHSDIEEIDVSSCDDPLPCLEHLVLEYCLRLVEIPPSLGAISTLKTITVCLGRPELKTSALGILEEQREFGNSSLQVFVWGLN